MLPQHVAIIMDGNGRWARERHLPRIEGHRAGADSARTIIRAAGEIGIKYLTLYAFSVENWNRPKEEVDALMKYLVHYLKTETSELNKNNVRLEVIGQIYRLPEAVQASALPPGTREGVNDWGRTGFGGPCPPIGRHRYFHKLYALDAVLPDLKRPKKAALEKAMQGHILAQAVLIGTYQKRK